MPKQKKSSKKRDLNNRKPNKGLAALREVLKGITPVPGVTPDPSRLVGGFLSQVMGSDSEGNVGFPITNAFLPPEERKTVGLVDETLAIPTLLELFGVDPPQFAKDAADRTDFLHNAIRNDMGLSEPEGLAENAEESLGVMLGQLPIPSKKKVDIVVKGILPRLKLLMKKIGGSAPEFFSPTIQPKASNYASGAAFGGALGMLGDEEAEESPPEFAMGGAVGNIEYGDLRNLIASQSFNPQMGMQNPIANPAFQRSLPAPKNLERFRIDRPRTRFDLFKYGMGPETKFYGSEVPIPQGIIPDKEGDLPPDAIPLGADAILPGGEKPKLVSLGVSGTRINPLDVAIINLRRRLGKADGGMVSDPVDDVLQDAGRRMMGLTRNIRMARGGKVSVLKMATGGKVSSFLSGVKSLRNDGKVGYSEAVDHFIKKDNPTVQELQEMVMKFKKTPEQIMKRLDQRRKVISSYQPMKIEDSLNYYPDLARRILDNGGSEDDIKNMTMPAKKKAALIAAFRNEMGEGKN